EARARRPQPGLDDKAIAAWNGLAIAAFADAARLLSAGASVERGLSDDYLRIAVAAAESLSERLVIDGRLRRSWRAERANGEGVLEDYACVADGLLALYEATADERWFVTARQLAESILDRFSAEDGGFFDTASDAETLVARPRDPQDNATPSGGSMAALVLLRLAAF